jgi:hypothetical protein
MVGIDLQKVWLELIAATDVARDDFVVETELFEQNGNLLAVLGSAKSGHRASVLLSG